MKINARKRRSIGRSLCATAVLFGGRPAMAACDGPQSTKEATPSEIRAYFKGQSKEVLTFLGYSGAGYEDEAALVRHATEIMGSYDPARVVVNIGATPDGIGRVYELAKQKGFMTTGIVSTQARESNATLSPCVDVVFYVKDASWGGFVEDTSRLSPTSEAMVGVSDHVVAIGGGDVARDELIAAKSAGKHIRFIPADMNHRIALERAAKRAAPPPSDFRGAADVVFGSGARAKP